MKFQFSLIGMLTILILCSCSKDEFTDGFSDEMPNIPNSVDVDIDNDGIADYQIEYTQSIIFSTITSAGIHGNFNPYGENEVLHKEDEKNLFLRNLDEIQEVVMTPFFWNKEKFREEIVSIYNAHSKWPTSWEANADIEHGTYLLGLKLNNNNTTQLGWVEIEINKTNGIISVLGKGIL